MKINFNIDEFKKTILPVYRPYLEDYKSRINVFYGGAGSGKSVFVTQKMIYKLFKSKRKCLVVRKVGATIRASIFEEFKTRLAEMDMTQYCKINKTDMTIELPNGSVFIMRGLDDQEKIKSISGIDDIVIEEATELTQEDFEQLNLRLRSKKKEQQIHLMFNPVSKQNWVYKYFNFDTGKTPKNTRVIKTIYTDNIFLPKAYIENMDRLKETNYAWWKIYANGEFSTLDKRVFTNWEVLDFNIEQIKSRDYVEQVKEDGILISKVMFPKSNPLYKSSFSNEGSVLGMDFGYNDPTAMTVSYVDMKRMEIYIYDEHYQRQMTNKDIAAMVKHKGYLDNLIIADSANPKDIKDLNTLGLRVKGAKKGKDSIMNGIRRLQQFKIYIHPKCENMIIEAENYTWTKDKVTGQYIDKPLDNGFCHLWDCLRYSTEFIKTRKDGFIYVNMSR